MRIVGGAWRGRTLVAPPGQATRPTADRVRQALFDMLMHAAWGGRGVIEGAVVLDVFAGTGALGLEALSRGAASACFIDSDAAALRALRANVAACKAADRVQVLAGDVLRIVASPPHPASKHRNEASLGHRLLTTPETWEAVRIPEQGPVIAATSGNGWMGQPASLVFLDPPYGQNLVPRALTHLTEIGRIAPGALVVVEIGQDEPWRPQLPILAERQHGAARILLFRSI